MPAACAGGVLLFAGFIALVLGVVFGFMKSSDVYKEAIARAKAEPAIVQALGSPIREGFFVTGNINVNGSSGEASLAIPISGPNGKATIYVEASKSLGQWTFSHLVVEIEKTGERIDLSDQRKPNQATLLSHSFDSSEPRLTEAQKLWALAVTGILTEGNHERDDLLAGAERTDENIKKQRKSLEQWWGIKSRKDLFKTLQWLDQEGHRGEFDQLGTAVSRMSKAEYKRALFKTKDNPQTLQRLETVRNHYQQLGDKSILAWDYCRFISLCRWCYLIGYINENEAWNCIMPAARQLQSTFGSWKELGENYLIGREFWSYEQTKQNGQYYRTAYEKLLSDPESPWNRYAWNLSLRDEGNSTTN